MKKEDLLRRTHKHIFIDCAVDWKGKYEHGVYVLTAVGLSLLVGKFFRQWVLYTLLKIRTASENVTQKGLDV